MKSLSRAVAGSSTPSGALTKAAGKSLAGAATPAGAPSRVVQIVRGGSVMPTGSLRTLIARTFTGAEVAPVARHDGTTESAGAIVDVPLAQGDDDPVPADVSDCSGTGETALPVVNARPKSDTVT